jgi:hypothetical protein
MASAIAITGLLVLPGCASFTGYGAATSGSDDRSAYLEREVARLKADLVQAEATMINIESGLRSTRTRAHTVSLLAEARIAVERVGQKVTWRQPQLEEAIVKLNEAERQLKAGHSGSAVFFASRARRIADSLQEEIVRVSQSSTARFVRAPLANLRTGPSTRDEIIEVLTESTPVFAQAQRGPWVRVRTLSGPVGWLHVSLLRTR